MTTEPPTDEKGAPEAPLRRRLINQVIRTTDALAVLPDAQRSRVLLGIQTRVMARRKHRRQTLILFCAAAVVLLSVGIGGLLRPARVPAFIPAEGIAGWEDVDLGEVGRLRVRVGSDYVLPTFPPACAKDATRVELHSGAVCAEVNHRDPALADPLVLATPDLVVEVVGTAFCVEAWKGVSVLDVSEGVVRAHTGSNPPVSVQAGETLRSDEARLAVRGALVEPMPPAPSPLAVSATRGAGQAQLADCAGIHQIGQRRRCYAARARGDGVRAANALYALALLDSEELADHAIAISELQTYQARFPDGILSPEVSVVLVRELVTVDRVGEAAAEAERFRARFPTHPRVEDVALLEGGLLLNRLARPADAARVYRTLIGRPLTNPQQQSLDAALRRLAPSIAHTTENAK